MGIDIRVLTKVAYHISSGVNAENAGVSRPRHVDGGKGQLGCDVGRCLGVEEQSPERYKQRECEPAEKSHHMASWRADIQGGQT